MTTPVDVKQPSPPHTASRGITTAAMLLLAAGVGLLGLESCTQAPEAKSKEPAVTDTKVKEPEVKDTVVKEPVAKEPEVKEPPPPPEPAMPPPAT